MKVRTVKYHCGCEFREVLEARIFATQVCPEHLLRIADIGEFTEEKNNPAAISNSELRTFLDTLRALKGFSGNATAIAVYERLHQIARSGSGIDAQVGEQQALPDTPHRP
jgi:hypothetical protein